MSHHLLNNAPFRIFNKFPRKSNFQAYLTYLEQIRIIIILLILFPSSEIRILCLLKSSSEMLQYLPRTRRFTYHWEFFFVINFMPNNTLSNSLFCWNLSSSTNFYFLKSNLLKLGRFYTNVFTYSKDHPIGAYFYIRTFFKRIISKSIYHFGTYQNKIAHSMYRVCHCNLLSMNYYQIAENLALVNNMFCHLSLCPT